MSNPWELIKQGATEEALELLDTQLLSDPDRLGLHMNKGLCLMIMGRLPDALAEYKWGCARRPTSDVANLMAGVISWWLGQTQDAIMYWEQAVTAQYTDAAGGIIAPAVLAFGGMRLELTTVEQLGLRLLRQRVRTKRALTWPGPVAGFLLGRMSSEELTECAGTRNPILAARQRAQAYFWSACAAYRERDGGAYQAQIERVIATKTTLHPAVMLETEYWLAIAEHDQMSR